MRRAIVSLAVLLSASAALAQDRPAIAPTRDATVTYSIGGTGAQGGGPSSITMAYQAATQMRRVDLGAMGYMVMDQRNNRAFMVMEAQRMIMDVPVSQAPHMNGLPENATFTRAGTAMVAGHRCILWTMRHAGGQGTACVTDDGVVLRIEGTTQGRSGGMEATQVSYGPIDPARFQRPAGYQTMQAPQMPGGAIPGQPPRR
jgi:hypothetical protein